MYMMNCTVTYAMIICQWQSHTGNNTRPENNYKYMGSPEAPYVQLRPKLILASTPACHLHRYILGEASCLTTIPNLAEAQKWTIKYLLT